MKLVLAGLWWVERNVGRDGARGPLSHSLFTRLIPAYRGCDGMAPQCKGGAAGWRAVVGGKRTAGQ